MHTHPCYNTKNTKNNTNDNNTLNFYSIVLNQQSHGAPQGWGENKNNNRTQNKTIKTIKACDREDGPKGSAYKEAYMRGEAL